MMNFLKNFPSLTVIFQNALDTFKRFPFAMLSALGATTCGIILSESENKLNEPLIQKLLLVSLLGLPLFIALKMFADKYNWTYLKSIWLQLAGFFSLLLYYFLLPEYFFVLEKYAIQYALLFTCFLFLNAFLPYLKGKNITGFWQYNKSMFLGYLTAMLYSHVMGLGLIIALAAMDNLFNMEIDSKRYFQIWIIVSILFNAWVFMAKLPTDLKPLETDTSYPHGLKMFIQYILLPLVGLYILILYTYEAKIILAWSWPIGWVSNLVLWYSVVSILVLLLLHPLREQKEHRWIQVFSKWFFRAMIPLVAMLFLAILRRISDYGITEARFAVIAMAVGLAVVVLYFVISKSKDIRILPITISLLAFVSAFSASPISKNSQHSRLETILIENNLLVDGELVTPKETPDRETRKEMSSIVKYLLETHGVSSFENLLSDSVISRVNKEQEEKINENENKVVMYNYGNNPTEICLLLGFEFASRWGGNNSARYFNIISDMSIPIDISTYDIFYKLSTNYGSQPYSFMVDSLEYTMQVKDSLPIFTITFSDTLVNKDVFAEIDLSDTLMTLSGFPEDVNLSPEDCSFAFTFHNYEAKIIFYRINGYKEENISISSFDGVLLLKKK